MYKNKNIMCILSFFMALLLIISSTSIVKVKASDSNLLKMTTPYITVVDGKLTLKGNLEVYLDESTIFCKTSTLQGLVGTDAVIGGINQKTGPSEDSISLVRGARRVDLKIGSQSAEVYDLDKRIFSYSFPSEIRKISNDFYVPLQNMLYLLNCDSKFDVSKPGFETLYVAPFRTVEDLSLYLQNSRGSYEFDWVKDVGITDKEVADRLWAPALVSYIDRLMANGLLPIFTPYQDEFVKKAVETVAIPSSEETKKDDEMGVEVAEMMLSFDSKLTSSSEWLIKNKDSLTNQVELDGLLKSIEKSGVDMSEVRPMAGPYMSFLCDNAQKYIDDKKKAPIKGGLKEVSFGKVLGGADKALKFYKAIKSFKEKGDYSDDTVGILKLINEGGKSDLGKTFVNESYKMLQGYEIMNNLDFKKGIFALGDINTYYGKTLFDVGCLALDETVNSDEGRTLILNSLCKWLNKNPVSYTAALGKTMNWSAKMQLIWGVSKMLPWGKAAFETADSFNNGVASYDLVQLGRIDFYNELISPSAKEHLKNLRLSALLWLRASNITRDFISASTSIRMDMESTRKKMEEKNIKTAELITAFANSDPEKYNADQSYTVENGMYIFLKNRVNVKLTIKTEEKEYDSGKGEFLIYAVDEKSTRVWEMKWQNITLTEFPMASKHIIYGNVVIIEVASTLYAIDLYSGAKLWEVQGVGVSANEPAVDSDDGTVYICGYDGPFITAVNSEGKVNWQKSSPSKDIYWPSKVENKEGQIIVTAEQAICTYDKNGNLIKTEKVTSIKTPPPNYTPLNPGTSTTKREYNFYGVVVKNCDASSILQEKNVIHVPGYMCDGDKSTAWVEGVQGDGIGEYAELYFDLEGTIKTVGIINGYAKSQETYLSNNRVKKVRITLHTYTDDIVQDFELSDNNLEMQTLVLKKPTNALGIKITILEVYKGTKYSDTCISEFFIN